MSGCDSCAAKGSCSSSGEDSGTCSGEKKLPPGMLDHYDTDQSTADGTLVFIETVICDGVQQMDPGSIQLVGKAVEMGGGRVFGVIFGGPERKELYNEAFSYGIDTLYHVRDVRFNDFHPEAFTESITSVCERVIPAVVLIGSTAKGTEIAPRLAASMGTGIVTNCSDLTLKGRKLSMFKDSNGKKVNYECVSFPQVATVMEGVFDTPKKQVDRNGTAFYRQYDGDNFKQIL